MASNITYDPDSGRFFLPSGEETGWDCNGYTRVMYKGKQVYAHRLAWFLTHDYWSEHDIDHINQRKADNRISNLREVSDQCNMRNTGLFKSNTSGVRGVYRARLRNKWMAYIMIDNKQIGLGYYKDFDDAVCARLAAEQCLDWNNCATHGSPAYKYVYGEGD